MSEVHFVRIEQTTSELQPLTHISSHRPVFGGSPGLYLD